MKWNSVFFTYIKYNLYLYYNFSHIRNKINYCESNLFLIKVRKCDLFKKIYKVFYKWTEGFHKQNNIFKNN